MVEILADVCVSVTSRAPTDAPVPSPALTAQFEMAMNPNATPLTLVPGRNQTTLDYGDAGGNPAAYPDMEVVSQRNSINSTAELEKESRSAIVQKGTQTMALEEASEEDTTIKAMDESDGSSPEVAATIRGATTRYTQDQAEHGGIQDDSMPLVVTGEATVMAGGDKAVSMSDPVVVGVDFGDDEDSMGGEGVNPSSVLSGSV
jgi:hypothetical protein